VTATGLPGYEVLVQAARGAMAAVPPVSAAWGTLERTLYDGKRRKAASKALDQWAPAIDVLTDSAGAARFLGYKSAESVRRKVFRNRRDGTPEWPEHDEKYGRSRTWAYRTIVIHQAMAPGRGSAGITRGPRKNRK